MNTEQILKVLKNERDCILNNHDYCLEDCDENCPYYVSGNEKIEVLDFLINGYEMLQNKGAESYMIKCKEPLSKYEIGCIAERLRGGDTLTVGIQPLSDNIKSVILGEKVVQNGQLYGIYQM